MIQTFFLGGGEGPFLPAKNVVVTLAGPGNVPNFCWDVPFSWEFHTPI